MNNDLNNTVSSKNCFQLFSIVVILGLQVMGDPKVCIVAFKSDKINVYSLADEMKKKGWLLSAMQYPTW